MMYQVSKDTTEFQYSVSCIIAGTLITLADGTKKPIENITYNDNLLVWDFYNGRFSFAKPSWIKVKQTAKVYNKLTFSNGTTLGLVGEGGTQGYHRIFNKQANIFTHTGVPETPNGTITFAEDQSEPVLLTQELIHENVDYYNITTDKHFNLFANGILTSCRCSNLYKIENMKYVGDRTMSDKEVEEWFKKHKSLQLAQ
nr:MAG TPA: Hint [Bacteriophage sp.]